MLPLLLLKFVAVSSLKYVPLPVFQTLVEHEVDVPILSPDRKPCFGPDGKPLTRKAKLLPRWAEFRSDWRKALQNSGLAFWHPHLVLRFFTNCCETVVVVLLAPRAIYGWTRRRSALAYWTLAIPHTDEPEQYRSVLSSSRLEIAKRSWTWIWSSVKLWDGTPSAIGEQPTVAVSPMRKNPNWRVLQCCGKAYAVCMKPRNPGTTSFALRGGVYVLSISSDGKTTSGYISTRTDTGLITQIDLSGLSTQIKGESNE